MKKCYYIFALLLSFCLVANAQLPVLKKVKPVMAKSDAITAGFGYADRYVDGVQGVGTGKSAILVGFIKVDGIKGATLKNIDVILADVTKDGKAAAMVLDKDYKVVSYENKTMEAGFNNMVLTTPYTFETDDPYYIGYLVHGTTSNGHPLGFDAKATISEGNYIGILSAEPALGSTLSSEEVFDASSSYSFGTLTIFAGIEGTTALDNMGYLLGVEGNFNVKPSENVLCLALVRNIGLKDMATQEFDVKVGENTQSLAAATAVEVGKTAGVLLTVPMPATGSGKVIFNMKGVNGSDNKFANVAATRKYVILVEGGPFPKETVLIEHLTTEKCPNCPAAEPIFEEYINKLTEAGLKVSVIEHHAGYYTDAFTIKESSQLLPYFFYDAANSGTFAPAAVVNRLPLGDNTSCAFFPSIESDELVKIVKDDLEFGKVEKVEQTFADGKVTVKVTGSVVNGLDEDLYITAVVTEDKLKAISQAGATGEFIHHDVARLFLSAATGDKATVNGNTFEITFPAKAYRSTWKAENMKIVILGHRVLNQANVNDMEQHTVLFSSNVAWDVASGIEDVTEEVAPSIAVNDGYVTVNGAFKGVEVYGMDGSLVANATSQRLVPGVYVVKVNTGNGIHTTKVVVK
ncbi:MAG: T9SS type A sorting domain-containing protein [Prevotella sp.]|nr:T9SS type A sorting domain-containing protein [Prevotella sp.]